MKVLLSTEWAKTFYPKLYDRYPEVTFVEVYNSDDIAKEIVDAEVVFGYINTEQFKAAAKLKWVQTLDAGMEPLFSQAPAIVNSDVTVTNAKGASAPQIGEHAVALILMFARGLDQFWHMQQERRWGQEYGMSIVQMVRAKTVGIVGFGKSGLEVGRLCSALGMNVLALDKHEVDGTPVVKEVWGTNRLGELLEQSDYVVVTVPMTSENAGMIGAAELGLMRSTAYLIVTSRGRLVDHNALVTALKAKEIAGAGLDVVVDEPLPPENELWDLKNVVITPHVAGNSPELEEWVFTIFEDNLQRYMNRQPLLNVVDKQLGY